MPKNRLLFCCTLFIFFTACSPSKKVAGNGQTFLQNAAIKNAHAGVCIFDASANRYIYNYQGDHYFMPASNTKLFSCYAALKHLDDSIIGLRYYETPDSLFLLPSGDPTLLYRDFTVNPVLDFLKTNAKPVSVSDAFWKENAWGLGWSWDDYPYYYMAERSPMPIYGNVAHTIFTYDSITQQIHFVQTPDVTGGTSYKLNTELKSPSVIRMINADSFNIEYPLQNSNWTDEVPFITNGLSTAAKLLGNKSWTIHNILPTSYSNYKKLHSQPLDSMLKPMMYRSDNFYAEQTLLMVSNELLGYMNDAAIIDTLLKTDYKDLPQKPDWIDGSGLSHYNLFTPEDFITLLIKMKNEFGLERIHNILPKGNTGTLEGLYVKIGDRIFGKTGTINGVVALSGYLTCKSGRLLIFSVLVNNHTGRAQAVRKAIEQMLMSVWEKY
ncbi:D-alanyl-D-alanine carboxypeptidase/D-alanyl-D-alanine-endopeptidase [Parafilimonas sp.]|uniref:D-alanyl-D-alanine carboxypeptidase/D-alanyl-D-alanine-endopeptidase n=1 Tax=Parafilimonas sp. TaxID=1969739 RepID=UPI0039E54161